MNLRILKKLSKRAAPYLPKLGDRREQFRAEPDDNYHGLVIKARKHFERCYSCHSDTFDEREIVTAPKCRAGTAYPYIRLRPPAHPWPATIMVGAMEGYEEPEWDEETAYEALSELVYWHFTDYDPVADDLVATRCIRTPRDIFAAADAIIAQMASA